MHSPGNQRVTDSDASLRNTSSTRLALCAVANELVPTIAAFLTLARDRFAVETLLPGRTSPEMLAAAKRADVVVVFIDAAAATGSSTRRHLGTMAALGVRRLVLVVHGVEHLADPAHTFAEISDVAREFAHRAGIDDLVSIALSERGDHGTLGPVAAMWYDAPQLLAFLERFGAGADKPPRPLRLSVTTAAADDVREWAATVISGNVKVGDSVRVLPSQHSARIVRVRDGQHEISGAGPGNTVTVALEPPVPLAEGDVIASLDSPPGVADQFEAVVLWLHEQPMLRGRVYSLEVGRRAVSATIAPLKYRLNVDTLEHVAASQLGVDEIGVCEVELAQPIVFDPYFENPETGRYTLRNRLTGEVVGVALLRFALRRSANLLPQQFDVDKRLRSRLKKQRPCVVWFTGLSGAGKSTIANMLETRLVARGRHSYVLDGDNVRRGLNKDLGFTPADRVENVRRVAEVARLMTDAGLIVLVSFISPFKAERRMARELMDPGEFVEVFVDTPLDVAEQRDPKGLYRKARMGLLKNFTGVDSPYEPPDAPELRLDTTRLSASDAADLVLDHLIRIGVVAVSAPA